MVEWYYPVLQQRATGRATAQPHYGRGDDVELLSVIRSSWSAETTDCWYPDDPSRHQCGVSALVVQDYCGGDIVRNKFGERTVYFNRLADGTRLFICPEYKRQSGAYDEDEVQSRDKIMQHPDMPRRYGVLSQVVLEKLTVV